MLATYFELILCLLTNPKNDLNKFEKTMYQVLVFHFELNSYLLTSSKSDLGEVDKAMIIVLALHFELIFFFLTHPKCKLRKFKKSGDLRDLKIDLWLFPSDLELWPLKFEFENLTLHQLKLRLTRRRWSDDYSSRMVTFNSFSASWLNLIANWKRCFKCSQSTLISYLAPCAA